jgi:hypothetical protein
MLITCASITGDRKPPTLVESVMTSRTIDAIVLILICTMRSSMQCGDKGRGLYTLLAMHSLAKCEQAYIERQLVLRVLQATKFKVWACKRQTTIAL